MLKIIFYVQRWESKWPIVLALRRFHDGRWTEWVRIPFGRGFFSARKFSRLPRRVRLFVLVLRKTGEVNHSTNNNNCGIWKSYVENKGQVPGDVVPRFTLRGPMGVRVTHRVSAPTFSWRSLDGMGLNSVRSRIFSGRTFSRLPRRMRIFVLELRKYKYAKKKPAK